MPSNEMFYRDRNGKQQDRKLHEAMLGDDRSTPEDEQRLITLAMSYGMTRPEAKAAFGILD